MQEKGCANLTVTAKPSAGREAIQRAALAVPWEAALA